MQINKVKLIKALEIIDKTPKQVIEWINQNFYPLCNNWKHWDSDKKGLISFKGDNVKFRYAKPLYVPKFVKEKGMSANDFSRLLDINKKERKEFIKILRSL